jgi:hypothetical protein
MICYLCNRPVQNDQFTWVRGTVVCLKCLESRKWPGDATRAVLYVVMGLAAACGIGAAFFFFVMALKKW